VSDQRRQPEGETEAMAFIVVNGRKLHPASLPGLMELDEDGDIVLYISPSLIRLRAQHEREQRDTKAES
jgi:hypothetical protein